MISNNISKMHKSIEVLISGLIGVIVGIISIVLFKKWSVFTISKSISLGINPLEVMTLGITALLAVYVARTISKKNDLEKSEKDLIISYLGDFQHRVTSKVTSIMENESFVSAKTNAEFKILRKRLDLIIVLAIEYEFITNNDGTANELKNKVREVWELVTDTPRQVNSRANAAAAVKEGIERLKLEQISKIEANLIDVEKLIFQITMKIYNK